MTEAQKAAQDRYKATHPDRIKETQRRYRQNHIDEIRARDREIKRAISQTPEYKAAKAAYDKEYRRKNREKIKAAKQDREYKAQRREHERKKLSEFRALNPLPPPMTTGEKRAKEKIWRDLNRDKWMAKNKRWYAENRDAACEQKKEYYLENKADILKAHNAYVRRRMQEDPTFRMRCYLHSRISSILRKRGCRSVPIDIIGCTPDELKAHIEKQFQPGMTWKNYGEWHCDHIYPLSLIDPMNPEQVKAAMNYKNLQPLWGLDNMSKGNRIPDGAALPEITSCIPCQPATP